MPERKRVLVMHALVEAHGGARGVLAWTLQALCPRFDVTLLTAYPVDFAALNRMFGTSLDPARVEVRCIPPLLRAILRMDPDPGSIQQACYLMRMAKQMRRRFHAVISTDNEVDFGEPALQYVHVPHLAHLFPKVLPSLDVPFAEKVRAWRAGRLRPWMLVGGYSFKRMKRNRTIVNSDWTGRWVRRVYGIDSVTIYPPAAGDFPAVPWEDRRDSFVIIGRLNPGKRVDWCLRVLEAVRRSHPRLRVHIIGGTSKYWDEVGYYRQLTPLVAANACWVTLHENVSRVEMERIVAGARYGMHAMIDEHFGMAVAEIVRAGCIPFVHNSGGPPEIVDHDDRVIYASEEEAVRKILAVLSDPCAQAGIRTRLAARGGLFGPEVFTARIAAEVERMTG